MEELQQKLDAETSARKDLEEKLGKQMDLMSALVASFQSASAASAATRHEEGRVSSTDSKPEASIYVSQGRKIPVFKDAPKATSEISVQDWCMDVERHLEARGLKGGKASSFILEHLGGKARQEILGRALEKGEPSQIFEVLKRIFGEGLTLGQLRTRFFSYRQQPSEDVVTCSLKLVEMMRDIIKLDESANATKNTVLRERLADAVLDETVQHELRRLLDEDEELDFFEARDRVLRWRGDVKAPKKAKEAVIQEKTAEDSPILMAIKGLTDQVSKLVQAQKGQAGRSSGLDAAGNRVCCICRSPDHMIRDCPKKQTSGRRDQRSEKKEELNSSAPQQ